MPKLIKTKKFIKNDKINIILNYLISSLNGVLFTVILLMVLSFIYLKRQNMNVATYIFSYLSIFLGALLSGFLCYKKINKKGILCGALSGLIYFFIIFIIFTLLLKFNISINFYICGLVSVLLGSLGGIISANLK